MYENRRHCHVNDQIKVIIFQGMPKRSHRCSFRAALYYGVLVVFH